MHPKACAFFGAAWDPEHRVAVGRGPAELAGPPLPDAGPSPGRSTRYRLLKKLVDITRGISKVQR